MKVKELIEELRRYLPDNKCYVEKETGIVILDKCNNEVGFIGLKP